MTGTGSFEEGKIFVGGLAQETTKETLKQHFSQYGNITDSVVMIDGFTNRSRGFGFVTFENADLVDTVLASKQKLDGKEVDCKKACPRDAMGQSSRIMSNEAGSNKGVRTDKIFVGGLPDISKEEFQSYFEKYGKVSDVVLMTDKSTGRPRGFGFVTFEDPNVVEEVLTKYNDHFFQDKWVEVKKATPKEQMSRNPGMPYPSFASHYQSGYDAYRQNMPYNGYPTDRRGAALYSQYPSGAYADPYATSSYVSYGSEGSRGRPASSNYAAADPYARPIGYSETGAPPTSYTPGQTTMPYGPFYKNYTPPPYSGYSSGYGASASYGSAAGYSPNDAPMGYAPYHASQRGNRSGSGGYAGRSQPY